MTVFYLPIQKSTKEKMKKRLKKYREENKLLGWYFFPCDAAGARSRAALCRQFAQECEAEERAK